MITEDIAPCGIACVHCELNENSGLTQIWERVAKAYGKTVDEIKCKGCRIQDGCVLHEDCKTLACVKAKGVDFCSDCGNFPCENLHPAVDGAERLPHNLKVYNLCRMKLLGAEKFLEEDRQNKRRYFTGKMVIGSGPQLKD